MQNYFICPRCGYKNTNGTSNICPVCGMDCGFYYTDKICLGIIFYGFISFLTVMFSHKIPAFLYDFIQWNGVLTFVLFMTVCVVMFFRALGRRGDLTDGFRTPDTVNDVLKGRVKHVDFRRFKNIGGNLDTLFDDNIAVGLNENNITLFRNHPKKSFYNLDYNNIKISLTTDTDITPVKAGLTGGILSTLTGPLWGIASGLITGIKEKKYLYIEGCTDTDTVQVLLNGKEKDLLYIYNEITAKKKRIILEED